MSKRNPDGKEAEAKVQRWLAAHCPACGERLSPGRKRLGDFCSDRCLHSYNA